MHTEDEAKKTWCPMARTGFLAGHGAVSINRHIDPTELEGLCNCLGSGCMMWRWNLYSRDKPHPEITTFFIASGDGLTEPERPANVPSTWTWEPQSDEGDPGGWSEPQEEANKRRRGFCGLIKS